MIYKYINKNSIIKYCIKAALCCTNWPPYLMQQLLRKKIGKVRSNYINQELS